MSNPSHEYLVEFATGQSIGLFKVGERAFHARAMTIEEAAPFKALYQPDSNMQDTDFVEPFSKILDSRKVDGGRVTSQWVMKTLTGTDLFKLMVFLTNPGRRAVTEEEASEAGGDLPN